MLVTAFDFGGFSTNVVLSEIAFVMVLAVYTALVVQLIRLPLLLRRFHAWGCIPILACFIAIPFGAIVGGRVFDLRLRVCRNHYESVAQRIYAGEYQLPLVASDADLALRAGPVKVTGKVAAVDFVTVTHGFAGHAGYMRIFDEGVENSLKRGEKPPGVWEWSWPLGSHWYGVGN